MIILFLVAAARHDSVSRAYQVRNNDESNLQTKNASFNNIGIKNLKPPHSSCIVIIGQPPLRWINVVYLDGRLQNSTLLSFLSSFHPFFIFHSSDWRRWFAARVFKESRKKSNWRVPINTQRHRREELDVWRRHILISVGKYTADRSESKVVFATVHL